MSFYLKRITILVIIASSISSFGDKAYAQLGFLNPVLPRDSAYIKNFPEGITGRALFHRKYTSFSIPGLHQKASVRYASNKRFLAGVGFTYKFFNLNVSLGLPYLNEDLKARGKTRSLDLQTYMFGRRWMFDLYGQFYGGFHSKQKFLVPYETPYYFRDDIRLRLIGGNAHYIFNPQKFSFRMALLQDEWQQRSSGTFLLNIGAFYGWVFSNADQPLVPDSLSGQLGNASLSRFRFFQFGPGLGYAYNWVIKKHFLISGAYSINIMGSFMRESSDAEFHDVFRVCPGMTFMASVGYHSNSWNFSMAWINNSMYYGGSNSVGNYDMRVGLYRFTVAKRFNNGKISSKVLQVIDKVSERNMLQEMFYPQKSNTDR